MKSSLLKFYITIFYFGATFVSFADPGIQDENNSLEDIDPGAPIGDYLWLLIVSGVLLVFGYFKYREQSRIFYSQK